MKKSSNLRIFAVFCILASVFSCKDLSVDSTNLIQPSDGTFGKISIEEAQRWYSDVLLKTPKVDGRARTNTNSSGHPTEKEGNFKAAYSINVEKSLGNIVVAPLYYKGMEKVVYYAGNDAKSASPKKEDIDRKAGRFQNNLIIYKQKDGRTEACVQRIIAYDSKTKKKDEVIRWKEFSGEVQYFDWNENFIFGFVMTKGEVTGRIASISVNPPPSKKNARTNDCNQYQVTSTCFSYYACTRNPQTGALENCSGVTVTNDCYVTNITCIDTSDPNLGYSIPPWMGGSGISPNNSAVAGVWDRGETINQIHNNPFSLLRTNDCPENVALWMGLANLYMPPAVSDRAQNMNTYYGWLPYSGVQTLRNAEGLMVNCDYFSVKVNTLPSNFSNNPSGFLEHIRTHMNDFVDNSLSTFTPHPWLSGEQDKWIGANGQDPTGTIMMIDIPIDPGSVILTEKTSEYWTFSTIKEPYAGAHPVSGNRRFGYVANSDGSYTYYAQGIDRVQARVDEVVGYVMNGFQSAPKQFTKADQLWTSFTTKIGQYVANHNGQSVSQQPVTKRPDWHDVADVLDGKKPISCP